MRFFLPLLSSIFLSGCALSISDTTLEGNNDKVYETTESKEDAKVKGHVTVTPFALW
jgi:hypothetical protein